MGKKVYEAPVLSCQGHANSVTHGAACPNDVLDATFAAQTPGSTLTCTTRAEFFS